MAPNPLAAVAAPSNCSSMNGLLPIKESSDWDDAVDSLSKLLDGDLCDAELNEITDYSLPNRMAWAEDLLATKPASTALNLDLDLNLISPPGSIGSASSSSVTSSTSSSTASDNNQSQAPRLFGRAVTLPHCPAPLPARGATLMPQPNQTVPMHVVSHVSVPASAPSPIAPRLSSPVESVVPDPGSLPSQHVPILPNSVEFPLFLPTSVAKPPLPASSSSELEVILAVASKEGPTAAQVPPRPQYRKRKADPSIPYAILEQHHKDRNKEHARNTRLRKKAYVETLKTTLNELVDERDATLRAATLMAQRQVEHKRVRWQVLQTFLGMRGRSDSTPPSSNNKSNTSEEDYRRWAAILEDHFALTRPSLTKTSTENNETVVRGISAVMADPNEATMIVDDCATMPASSMNFDYICDRNTLLMDGCTCVVQWRGSTHDAVTKLGLPSEIALDGTLRVKFNETTNKLVSATLLFDTGTIRR